MKMIKYFTLLAMLITLNASGQLNNKIDNTASTAIKINWMNNVNGDFSFKNKWEYPEGIYRNEYGQLVCDGFCPPDIEKMIDENGMISKDSLISYYQIVDTTHIYHSIQSEARTYEYAGTHFVTTISKNADTTICFTHTNAGTHSSLHLLITNNKCVPYIKLNSINSSKEKIIYYCKSGFIDIDKKLWAKGILKAKFNFVFYNKDNHGKEMYWKGKIYSKINFEAY